MATMTVTCMTEGVDEAVRRACADKAYRELLLAKPEAALAELGVALRPDQRVLVVDFQAELPPPLVIHLPPLGAELLAADAFLQAELVEAVSVAKDGRA